MKKTFKIISLLLLIAITTTLFVSCASDEITLFNALCNSSEIKSMESKTELSLTMEATGFSQQEQQVFQQISPILNGSKITIDQKSNSNTDKTSTKAQVDVAINMGGMALSTSVWVDSDLSGAKPKMKEIIKIPSILTASLPAQYQGKPYLIIDGDQLLSTGSTTPTTSFDFTKLTEFSKNITPKLIAFLKVYLTQFDPGFNVITKKADKTIDGQTLSVYELKLDDQSFKALINYGVNNFIQNENALSFTKDLLISLIDITSVTAKEKTDALKEINKSFDELKAGLPEFKNQWDTVMNALKDVKILGDKGIDLEFGINSDGYIVSEDGTLNLNLDLKAFSDVGDKLNLLKNIEATKKSSIQTGHLKIGVDFHKVNTNINKEILINIPEINKENSFNLMDFVSTLMPSIKETTPAVKVPTPTLKDKTPPAAPVVNKVLHTSKSLTGKAEIGSKIIVKSGKTILGTGVVNSKGIFSISIKPQKSKRILLVTATDKSGNISKATSVTVK